MHRVIKANKFCFATFVASFVVSLIALGSLVVSQEPGLPTGSDSSDLFSERIAPVLASRCIACHCDRLAESDYRMGRVDQLFVPGASGEMPVVAGDPQASELLRRLMSTDPDVRMPPDSEPLPADEIESIRQWIAEGAKVVGSEQKLLGQIADDADRKTIAPEHYPRALPISSLAWAADRQSVWVSGYHEITRWNVADGKLAERIGQLGRRVACISASEDGKWIAVSSGIPGQAGTVSLHSISDTSSTIILFRDVDIPASIAFAPRSQQIAIGGADGVLRVIEVETAKTTFQAAAHADAIQEIQWSFDGQQLMSASRDRTARLLRVEGWQWIAAYDKHERAVGGVTRIQTGIVTLDETGKLRVWPSDNGEYTIAARDGFSRRLVGIQNWHDQVLVPVGPKVLRTKIEWKDVDDGKDKEGKPKTKKQAEWIELPKLDGTATSPILSLSLHPNSHLATGTLSGQVQVWSLTNDDAKLITTFLARP
jgi:Planctomycete cytochrome C/WD domain, G-beta repeat